MEGWKIFTKEIYGRKMAFVIPEGVTEERYFAQSYVKKQLAIMAENPSLVDKPQLLNFRVEHDDWCDLLSGLPLLCSCDATVEVISESVPPHSIKRKL